MAAIRIASDSGAATVPISIPPPNLTEFARALGNNGGNRQVDQRHEEYEDRQRRN